MHTMVTIQDVLKVEARSLSFYLRQRAGASGPVSWTLPTGMSRL